MRDGCSAPLSNMAGDEIRREHERGDQGEGVQGKRSEQDPIVDISGFLKHLAPKKQVTVEAMREGILRRAAEKHTPDQS